MGFFKLIHDFIGIDGRKVSNSVKKSMNSIKSQKEKLRNCERVRKIKN
jgi:hypothetical protein